MIKKVAYIVALVFILAFSGCTEKGTTNTTNNFTPFPQSIVTVENVTSELKGMSLNGVTDIGYSVDLTNIAVAVTDTEGGKKVTIVCPPRDFFNTEAVVKHAAGSSVYAMAKMFTNPTVQMVTVVQKDTFIDAYGKSSIENAVIVTMDKATADKINWGTFKDMVLVDYKKLFNVATDYYIHPAILKKL